MPSHRHVYPWSPEPAYSTEAMDLHRALEQRRKLLRRDYLNPQQVLDVVKALGYCKADAAPDVAPLISEGGAT